MIHETHFYKLSGRVPPAGVLRMAAVGVLVSMLFGFVYAFVTYFLPFAFLNPVITIFYGMAIGIFALGAARKGKVRNRKVAIVGGAFTGMFAVYTQWVFWLFAHSISKGDAIMIWELAELWQRIVTLSQTATLPVPGQVGGIALWTVWGIEAFIIVAISTAIGRMLALGVFCERCEQWAEEDHEEARLQIDDRSPESIELLSGGDFGVLKSIPLDAGGNSTWLRISTCTCMGCRELNTMDAAIVTVEKDKKGNDYEAEKPVLDGLLVPAQTLAELRGLWWNKTDAPAGGIPQQDE